MRYTNQLHKLAGLLVAALVLTLTVTTVSRAVVTTTTANAAFFTYNLGAGAAGPLITPPGNQSAHVMGCCLTPGVRGIGHIALLRVAGNFLEWVGQHSPASGATTQGFSAVAGVDMVKIDFAGGVVLEVANANQFRVRNQTAGARNGNVTMVW